MKYEWRKKEKDIYLPKREPEIIQLPQYNYVIIDGAGNPNSDFFAEYISVLYTVSYAIKMNLKKVDVKPEGYIDYTVYPLEGVWGITEDAKKAFKGTISKDDLVFNLMIRQPDFVKEVFFNDMIELVREKNPSPLLNKVRFEAMSDGDCIQMMHIGSYDDEPISFKLMEEYAKEKGLKRLSKKHREIYLSDFRKVPKEKLKTVLRFQVK